CTWSGHNAVYVVSGIGITIKGAGNPSSNPMTQGADASCSQTTIIDALTDQYSLFAFEPNYGASPVRISCMKVVPTLPPTGFDAPFFIYGTCTTAGCPSVRLDNIIAGSNWVNLYNNSSIVIIDNVFGVADHSTIGDTYLSQIGISFVNVAHQ